MTLDELRRLSEAATSGPWQATLAGDIVTRNREWSVADVSASGSVYGSEGLPVDEQDANANLIAAAVNYVRELLAEADQPIYLGCGCAVGTHENSIDAMKIAHPDLIVPEITGPFYGSASPEPAP